MKVREIKENKKEKFEIKKGFKERYRILFYKERLMSIKREKRIKE